MTVLNSTNPDNLVIPTRIGVCTDDYFLRKYGQDLFTAPGTVLKGVCHPSFPVAKYLARAWRAPLYTEEFATFLESSDMDTILMMQPLPDRTEWVRKAVEAGKNVLYPPPLSINPEDYASLRNLAAEHKVYVHPLWTLETEPSTLFANDQLLERTDVSERQIRCHWMLPPLMRREPNPPMLLSPLMDLLVEGIHFCNVFLGDVQSISAEIRPPSKSTRQTIGHLILNHPGGISIHHITQVAARDVRQLIIMDIGAVSLEVRIPHRSPTTHVESTHHALIYTDTGRKMIRYPHTVRNGPAALPRAVELLTRIGKEDPRGCLDGLIQDEKGVGHLHACFVSTRESMKVATPMTVTQDMVTWIQHL